MQVCIHKNILGTDRHLFANKAANQYYWSNHITEDTWVFGEDLASQRCVGPVLEALDMEIATTPGEKYASSWREVGKIVDGDVNWEKSLSPDVFKKFVSGMVDQLWCVLKEVDDTYYGKEFQVCRDLTRSLVPAKIDVPIFNQLLSDSQNLSHRRSLSSFSPGEDGCASVPVYSTASSTTGRLTVKSGPNILTMKKELRKIFKSRYPGGKILQIDFVSLEPRVLLAIQNIKSPDDIYDHIREEVLKDQWDRSVAKSATLGAIFGISAARFQENSSISPEASSEILRSVRKFFNVSSFGKILKQEMFQKGYIENAYGRKITPSSSQAHVLINNKVQSTGVDVALLGFSTLLQSFSKENLKVLPLFLIHDAIVVDVPRTSIQKVEEITSAGIYNDKLSSIFPVSIEEI